MGISNGLSSPPAPMRRGSPHSIALVGPELEENLSLRYLASALESAGFRTDIIAFNGPGDFMPALERILTTNPFVVGVSLAFQWRAMDFIGLAIALRERGYEGHITAGGHFGTFTWGEVLEDFPEIDSICLHEAEETVVELARALCSGGHPTEISGLATRQLSGTIVRTPKRRPPAVDSLPWPDRRGEPAFCLGHPIATLVASRGCYANCAFCCIAAWHRSSSTDQYHRLRPVEDVADEMVWLNREQGVEIFNFHDDNFLPHGREAALARVQRLADALERRGLTRFATLTKARPNDVHEEIFSLMQERLGLVRLFIGIETDSEQGLRTLRRGVTQRQNREAISILDGLGIYVFFNLLVFDPDTDIECLEGNLDFMERTADAPLNFGRVELYAGTPLLARMQAEGRCTGDYVAWDYRLADPSIDRIFRLAMRCFHARNFSQKALAHRLVGTRFDVEICRRFHPERYDAAFREDAKGLCRAMALDSVSGLREIIEHVRCEGDESRDGDFVKGLARRLDAVDTELHAAASELEGRVQRAVSAPCRHARNSGAGVALTRSLSM